MSNINEQFWTNKISKELVGRKIVSIRYMSDEEKDNMMWNNRAIIIKLDNGTVLYPSQDDEGNDAGSIFYQSENELDGVIPVMR